MFIQRNGAIKGNYGHSGLPYLVENKAKILIVEKPGVQYLEATDPNMDFDKYYSLESWSATIQKAIRYVIKNEKIDDRKIMVMGHSEGGITAAYLANHFQPTITHTTILAGEGPSQLFSLYEFAKEGVFFDKEGYSMEQRIDSLQRVWKAVLADANSTEKQFWGFTYKRWSSFLRTSVQEQLADFKGKIFIAQGTEDKNVSPLSAEVAYTSLLSKGKDVHFLMMPHADHSFNIVNDKSRNGWKEVLKSAIEWFLQ